MTLIHLSVGGPNRTIQVNGKRYLFEMHGYCGPMAINKDGSECLTNRPDAFWEAVSFWAQQGEKVGEDGLCVWEYPERKEPITKQINRRNALVIGWKTIPAVKGE